MITYIAFTVLLGLLLVSIIGLVCVYMRLKTVNYQKTVMENKLEEKEKELKEREKRLTSLISELYGRLYLIRSTCEEEFLDLVEDYRLEDWTDQRGEQHNGIYLDLDAEEQRYAFEKN